MNAVQNRFAPGYQAWCRTQVQYLHPSTSISR
jgi:hypothetical protein